MSLKLHARAFDAVTIPDLSPAAPRRAHPMSGRPRRTGRKPAAQLVHGDADEQDADTIPGAGEHFPSASGRVPLHVDRANLPSDPSLVQADRFPCNGVGSPCQGPAFPLNGRPPPCLVKRPPALGTLRPNVGSPPDTGDSADRRSSIFDKEVRCWAIRVPVATTPPARRHVHERGIDGVRQGDSHECWPC